MKEQGKRGRNKMRFKNKLEDIRLGNMKNNVKANEKIHIKMQKQKSIKMITKVKNLVT